ncbi:MAG: HHHH-motif protein [Paraburkholderia sp.]
MKTVLFAGLMPAASLAALTRGMAQAHSHRECHWDNHHHRVCHWVH